MIQSALDGIDSHGIATLLITLGVMLFLMLRK